MEKMYRILRRFAVSAVTGFIWGMFFLFGLKLAAYLFGVSV